MDITRTTAYPIGFEGRCFLVIALMLATVVFPTVAARADAPVSASGFQDIRTDIQSPHFDWMAPAADEQPRVLFFFQRRHGRDVVEVAQRWPINYAAVSYGGWRERPKQTTLGAEEHLAWRDIRVHPEMNEKTRAYVIHRLEAELAAEPNVMVVDAETWDVLDEPQRRMIWDRVQEGMGLVYAKPGEAFEADLENRGTALDEALIHNVVSPLGALIRMAGYQVGEGRVAIFDVRPPSGIRFLCPRSSGQAQFELSMAQALRAIQWAGRSDASVRVTGIRAPKRTEWPIDDADRVALNVSSDADKTLQADIRLLDAQWREVGQHAEQVELTAGDDELALPLPAGPAGELTAVVRLYDGDAVVAFGAAAVEVTSSTSVELTLPSEAVPADEPVAVQLDVSGARDEDEVVVELYDHADRLVARQLLQVADGQHDVELMDADPRSRFQRVEAGLLRGGELAVRADATLYRRLSYDPLDFRHFTWRAYNDTFYVRNHLAHMRGLGLNAAFQPGAGAEYLTNAMRHDLDFVSITHTAPRKRSDTQVADLVSPDYFEENREKLVGYLKSAEALGGQWAFSHGDELYIRGWDPNVRDVTVSPVREAFIDYLRRDYGDDIAAFNQAWGTSASTFDDIDLPNDIAIPSEPRAPWLDYSRFLIDAFCGYFEKLNEAARAEVPDAVIGIDGIEQFSPFDGNDWYRLQKAHDGIVIYPHEDHDNKLYSWRAGLSFMPRHGFNGYWIAYDSDFVPDVAAGYPWRALFVGLGSMGYFQAYEETDPYSAMYPDWRARPAYQAVTDQIRRIQSGFDHLLLGAERQHSPIAVHYSQRSWALSFPSAGIETHINQLGQFNAHRIYRGGYDGHVATNGSAFLALLLDMGHQPRMVATEQIEAGALSDYRMLVLPYSQSLTDGEVRAIRAFAEAGGVVIADYRTGIRDGRGNLRSSGGSLDDLFGIQQLPEASQSEQPMVVAGYVRFGKADGRNTWSFAKPNERFDNALIGGPVALTDDARDAQLGPVQHTMSGTAYGEARDGTPVFLVNRVGEGLAIYLNFSLEPYLDARSEGQGGPYVELLRDVVGELASVPLPVYVAKAEQGFANRKASIAVPETDVEVNRFVDGDAEYVGMAWSWKRPDWSKRTVQARFVTPAHTYDALSGTYLGYTDKTTFTVEGGVPVKLLARLPYQVTAVDVAASTSHAARGEAVDFDVEVVASSAYAPEGRHVIRVEVQDEAGRACEAEGDVLIASGGGVKHTWHLPHNIQPGAYTVTFTDVATGVAAQVAVEVE